jgi:guanosine-3',5'-bis(diphosphate) 3'-pyrophosphohydrolase
MDQVLQQVRDYADKAHGDQMRKYGPPARYIVHPERVMKLTRQVTNDPTILSAALLHDVLEDTSTTEQEIKDFLQTLMSPSNADRTMQLVLDLTDVYTKENYPQWNRRKRRTKEADRLAHANPDAQTIKYADIIDNCPEIVKEDPDFGERYISECRELLGKMKNGNPQLRQQALDVINKASEQLKEQ